MCLTAPGELIPPDAVTVPKARDLVRLLLSEALPYVRLVECRRRLRGDVVVFDVEPEVPQVKVHDIRRTERIAVTFTDGDDCLPDTIALREDFPSVPHLNLRLEEFPRSLCLWEEPYADLRLRWTAAGYVMRVREWLALTARGELHESDQPLEPLIAAVAAPLILPAGLFGPREDKAAWLSVRLVETTPTVYALVADGGPDARHEALPFVALPLWTEVQTHGVIRKQPRSIAELHGFLATTGFDLLGTLRARFRDWIGNARVLDARLILVVSLPKRRADTGPAETTETWGFLTVTKVRQVGVEIGAWDLQDGTPGLILAPPPERNGSAVGVDLLNPVETLTREGAALLNGLTGSVDTRVVAVGAGALGSQVIVNLARAGYGHWTVVDSDWLLPHNLARHYLGGYAIGEAKANAVSWITNALLDAPKVATPIVADVLTSATDAQLGDALRDAGLIADFSASVTVARHLALDVDSSARRASVFLNPDGTDLVVLAEDEGRGITLDNLEMQYYREVSSRGELEHHLTRRGERLRYAHSCRDVTGTLPHDAATTLAGVAARALRSAVARQEATIAIWHTDEDLSISSIRVPPAPTVRFEAGDWKLCTDEVLLAKLRGLRAARLPNETGGVLIGSYDLQRRIVYMVDTIPSPPDSEEWPTLYIRGSEGLKQRVQEIENRTAGWLQYVGEWHSHPNGYSCRASSDDYKVFGWITSHLGVDGLPGLMLIVGEGEQIGIHLGQI